MLEIKDLKVSLEDGEQILKGLNLKVKKGQVVSIMGPNGSGKSTLARVIMGDDRYNVDEGDIIFEGESIRDLPPHERAKRGIFVSFQNPPEIEGVRFVSFIPMVLSKLRPDDKRTVVKLRKDMVEVFKKVGLDEDFISRHINVGFSGGERKKAEIAQLYMIKPKLAILDEIDSGLDVDSLARICEMINELRKEGMTFILITHYPRILHHVEPDVVHVLLDGKVVATGGMDLALEIEREGYKAVIG